jgi:hypothetical protein
MVVRDVSLEDVLVSARMTRDNEPFYLNDDNLHRIVETEADILVFSSSWILPRVRNHQDLGRTITEWGLRTGFPERTSFGCIVGAISADCG